MASSRQTKTRIITICFILLSIYVYTIFFNSIVFFISKPIAQSLDYHLSINAFEEINTERTTQQNNTYPKTLLGLGVAKSGTAFANSLLCRDLYQNRKKDPQIHIQSNNISYVCRTFRYQSEYHFWSKCPLRYHPIPSVVHAINSHLQLFDDHGFLSMDNCSFTYFIDRFLSRHLDFIQFLKSDNNISSNIALNASDYRSNENIVLTEKSSDYFSFYHIALLFTNYASFIPLRMYVVFRSPIQRIWSQYWATCRRYVDMRGQGSKDGASTCLQSDIDKFASMNPDYMAILNMLNGADDLDDIDTSLIIDTMRYASYRYGQFKNDIVANDFFRKMSFHPFMKSCYFNQLIMWNLLYNETDSDQPFYALLKVFSSEYLYEFPKSVQWRLKCWGYFGGDYDLDEYKEKCMKGGRIRSSHVKVVKYNKATGNNSISEQVSKNLNNLLMGCNKHLHGFLQQSPQFVLGQNINLIPWLK